jgi:hypothetical protein
MKGDTAALREIRNAAGEHIGLDKAYHTIFPFGAFEDAVYCSACNCTKSDDAAEPNPITEACSNEECLCHDCEHVVVDLALGFGGDPAREDPFRGACDRCGVPLHLEWDEAPAADGYWVEDDE